MRTRIGIAWVVLLAGFACNGPISDWPESSSDNDGPQASPGPRDAGLPGQAPDDAEAAMDASAGEPADAGTSPSSSADGACGADALDAHVASDGAADALGFEADTGASAAPSEDAEAGVIVFGVEGGVLDADGAVEAGLEPCL